MKNMNWKKAVSLLMAAVLVGSLTACSGGQGQKEASTELQKAEEKNQAESTQAKKMRNFRSSGIPSSCLHFNTGCICDCQ